MDNQKPTYKQGYNYGYLIAKHRPELSEQLKKSEGEHEFVQGLKDGQQRFEGEKDKHKDKGKSKTVSKFSRLKSPQHKKGKGRGGRDR